MHQNELIPAKVAGIAAIALMALAMFAFPEAARETGPEHGDAERGKTLFEKRCTGCHSLDQDKEGPRLRGVYGRKAGTIPSFQYSEALKGAQIT